MYPMSFLLIGICALLLGMFFTRLVRDGALKFGLVDHPDHNRKVHKKPIPRLGGVAIICSYAISLLVIPVFAGSGLLGLTHHAKTYWLLAGLAVVFGTGLIDDLTTLTPLQKLAGQFAAAVLVWSGGVQVHMLQDVHLNGWLSLPITVSWLLLCMNAFNLIDGLDGLAAGSSLVSTIAMLAAAMLDKNTFLILMITPLVGALLGFLRFNFNPATIFLGDSGSLSIGFLLGCFGVMWGEKTHTLLSLLAPAMAMSLPLLETGLSIVRRYLRRRPIFSPDREHIHHRLLDRGKTPRQAALLLYAAAGLTAILALLEVAVLREMAWLVVVIFIIVAAAAIRYLEYREFEFARRLFTGGVVFSLIDDQMHLNTLKESLQLAKTPEEAHRMVRAACHQLGFREVNVVEAGWDNQPLRPCVTLAMEPGRFLVLDGMPKKDRPVAITQLQELLTEYFRSSSDLTVSACLSGVSPLQVTEITSRSRDARSYL